MYFMIKSFQRNSNKYLPLSFLSQKKGPGPETDRDSFVCGRPRPGQRGSVPALELRSRAPPAGPPGCAPPGLSASPALRRPPAIRNSRPAPVPSASGRGIRPLPLVPAPGPGGRDGVGSGRKSCAPLQKVHNSVMIWPYFLGMIQMFPRGTAGITNTSFFSLSQK